MSLDDVIGRLELTPGERALMERGEQLWQHSDYSGALKVYDELVNTIPATRVDESARVHLRRAHCYFELNDVGRGIREIEFAQEYALQTRGVLVIFNEAWMIVDEFMRNHSELSQEDKRKLREIHIDLPISMKNARTPEQMQERLEYSAVVARLEEKHYFVAEELEEKGNYEAAIKEFRAYIERLPPPLSAYPHTAVAGCLAHRKIARCLDQLGKEDEALREYATLIEYAEKNPTLAEEVIYTRKEKAYLYESNGRLSDAIREYKTLISLGRELGNVRSLVATWREKKNELEQRFGKPKN